MKKEKRRNRLKPWTPELWALAGTLAMTAVLGTLLAVFDGRAIFDWNNITLNTIVSMLSVVIKALLLFAVAECIGQWKWILLHRGQRSLLDFERVDLASRGPLGCLELTWRRDTPWLLRVGLVVTMLTVAIDPFSQQLVQIRQGTRFVQSVEGSGATTPRSVHYSLGTTLTLNMTPSPEDEELFIWEVDARPDLAMEAAILQGLSQSSAVIEQGVGIVCPSSSSSSSSSSLSNNCTFDRFETLGVCHRCTDLTSQLERVDGFGDFHNLLDAQMGDNPNLDAMKPWRAENATAFALPHGHFLTNTNSCRMTEDAMGEWCTWESRLGMWQSRRYPMTAYSTGHPSQTGSSRDIDTLIWSTSVIHIDEKARKVRDDDSSQGDDTPEGRPWNYWPESPVRATECAVYYCVKEVEDAFTGNLVREATEEADGFRRTPESFRNNTDRAVAPENVPEEPGSLVFDTLQSYLELTDLRLNRTRSDGTVDASYVVAESAVKAISAFVQKTFRWENADALLMAIKAREKIPGVNEVYNGIVSNTGTEPLMLGNFWRDAESHVEARFEALAMAMTNEMRRNSGRQAIRDAETGGRVDGAEAPPDEPVAGRIGLATVEYRVVWYWITLHAVLLLGSLLFCAATIFTCSAHGVPVWKSHSLATMSQGSTIRVDFQPEAGDLKELEKRAGAMVVGLVGTQEIVPLRRWDSSGDQEHLRGSPTRVEADG